MKMTLSIGSHGHRWVINSSPFTPQRMASFAIDILRDSINLKLPTPLPVIESTARMVNSLGLGPSPINDEFRKAALFHLCEVERAIEDRNSKPMWQYSATAVVFMRTPECKCPMCSAIRGYKQEMFNALVEDGCEHGMQDNMSGYLNGVGFDGCVCEILERIDWNLTFDSLLKDKSLIEDLRLTNEEVKKAVKLQNEKGE